MDSPVAAWAHTLQKRTHTPNGHHNIHSPMPFELPFEFALTPEGLLAVGVTAAGVKPAETLISTGDLQAVAIPPSSVQSHESQHGGEAPLMPFEIPFEFAHETSGAMQNPVSHTPNTASLTVPSVPGGQRQKVQRDADALPSESGTRKMRAASTEASSASSAMPFELPFEFTLTPDGLCTASVASSPLPLTSPVEPLSLYPPTSSSLLVKNNVDKLVPLPVACSTPPVAAITSSIAHVVGDEGGGMCKRGRGLGVQTAAAPAPSAKSTQAAICLSPISPDFSSFLADLGEAEGGDRKAEGRGDTVESRIEERGEVGGSMQRASPLAVEPEDAGVVAGDCGSDVDKAGGNGTLPASAVMLEKVHRDDGLSGQESACEDGALMRLQSIEALVLELESAVDCCQVEIEQAGQRCMELSVQRNEAVRECARLTEELARMTQQCRSRAQELASRAHQCRQTAEAHDGALAEIRRLTAANEALQEAKDASETEFEFRRCLQVEREAVAAQQAQQAQRVLQLELQPPTDATVVTARLLQQLEVAEGKLKHAQAREQALEALLQQRQAIEEDALESNSERTGKHAEHSFGEIRAGPIAVARGMSDTALVSTVSIVFALTLVHLVHRLVIRRN